MINIAILRCNSLHFIFFFTITAGEKFKDFRFLGIPEVSGIMFFFFLLSICTRSIESNGNSF